MSAPESFQSRVVGVTHPVSAVADVRGADARRRESHRCAGVIHAFQVCEYKVEPRFCVLACNLFTKDLWRATLADEAGEVRPEVSLVFEPFAFARLRERLAGARSGPDTSAFGPSGELERERPSGDAGKEVTLAIPGKISSRNLDNAASVDAPVRDEPVEDEVLDPRCGVVVDFIVVVHPALQNKNPRPIARPGAVGGTHARSTVNCARGHPTRRKSRLSTPRLSRRSRPHRSRCRRHLRRRSAR